MSRAQRWLLSTPTIAVLAWIEYLISVLLPAIYRLTPPTLEADDAMRLVQVRDLLAGQSWWDLTQYRLSPPAGTVMHWTRIVDAPLASLVLFFRIFTSQQTAEILAVSVWPVLLLLPAWLAVARIATRLADREAGLAVLFLAITCVLTLGYFKPGEIDHHNAQIVLTLWTTALVLEIETSPKALAWCGALCGVSLGIGLETLPYVLAICAIVASLWIWRGDAVVASARHFGIALACTAAFLTVAAISKQARFHADCATFSGIYEACTMIGALGLTALTALRPLSINAVRRAISIAALSGVIFAVTAIFAPACLQGPYHYITPELNRIFLSRIQEAQSPLATALGEIGFFFATYFYGVVGIASLAVVAFIAPRDRRHIAICVLAIGLVALAVTTLELRGVPFAILLGLPGMAALIRLGCKRWLKPGIMRAMAMIALLALFSELSFDIAGSYWLEGANHVHARLARAAESAACMEPDAVAPLRHFPQGQVAAFLDAAPSVLLYTRDSVTAGAYRDPDAIIDLYRLYTAAPNEGLEIVQRRHIDYLMICRQSADYAYYMRSSPFVGLIHRLSSGDLPSWLEKGQEISKTEIYVVKWPKPTVNP
jgi:hypothetical protein